MWAVCTAMGLAVVYGLSDYYANPGPKNVPSTAEDVIYLTYSRYFVRINVFLIGRLKRD